MHDGSIEIMVHRRTLNDDSQGVGEPINENAYGTGLVIRGRHFLILESPETSALYHRSTAQRVYLAPVHTYALPNVSYADYSNNYRQTWSALSESLPYNVHLLTIDQWTSKVYLVRIEHYFELNEDATYSKPVQVDLQILFNSLGKINDTVELILTGNLPLDQLNRLVWKTDQNESSYWKSSSMKIKFI
jgi:lysosomal alpha-mannosidase